MGFWTRTFIRELIRESRRSAPRSKKIASNKDEGKFLGFTKEEWGQSGLKTIGMIIVLIVLLNLVAVHIGN